MQKTKQSNILRGAGVAFSDRIVSKEAFQAGREPQRVGNSQRVSWNDMDKSESGRKELRSETQVGGHPTQFSRSVFLKL